MTEMDLIQKQKTELEAINQIPTGIGIFDVTGTVVTQKYLNDGFYQMIGAKRKDRSRFFSTGTINSVHPDDQSGLLAEVESSIREQRNFEFRFRNLDGAGNYMWIGIRASHKKIDEHTERFFAVYYNVNNYIQEQKELEGYNTVLDAILGNVPGGIAVFSDHHGKVHLDYTNSAFYRLHHGFKNYWDTQSDNPVDWLLEEDKCLFWNEFEQVKNGTKQLGSVTYRIIGEDGGRYWVNNQFRKAYVRDSIQYYYASFMYCAAYRTGPFPYFQVLCLWVLCAAYAAGLCTCIVPVNCDHVLALFLELVLEEAAEHSKAVVICCLAQMQAACYCLHAEVLYDHGVTGIGCLPAQLMAEVLSAVGYLFMGH